MAEEPFMADEPVLVVEEPVMAEEPFMADEPVLVVEEPVVAEEAPVVASDESFYAVEPSPFMAEEPIVAEEDEAWFVADVQEEPAPAPERPAQSDTWSGRSIGS